MNRSSRWWCCKGCKGKRKESVDVVGNYALAEGEVATWKFSSCQRASLESVHSLPTMIDYPSRETTPTRNPLPIKSITMMMILLVQSSQHNFFFISFAFFILLNSSQVAADHNNHLGAMNTCETSQFFVCKHKARYLNHIKRDTRIELLLRYNKLFLFRKVHWVRKKSCFRTEFRKERKKLFFGWFVIVLKEFRER